MNKTYDTFNNNNNNQVTESTTTNIYYPTAIPPDPLQRYGSGHLDQDIFGISVSRSNIVQQMVFVRKIILITLCQLFTLTIMIFFIVRICPLFQWLKDSTWTWWIPILPTFLLSLVVIWQLYSQYFLLSQSTQMTLLALYSVLISLVVSNIVSKLFYEEGMLVIFMTFFGLCGCLCYTLQKRFQFKGAFPFVCSLGAICLSSPWLRYVYDMDPLEILFPITIASVACVYIILEIYYIMKNVTSNDYLLANISFFVDLIYPIRFIHHFCELTDNMNFFPDILYPGDTR